MGQLEVVPTEADLQTAIQSRDSEQLAGQLEQVLGALLDSGGQQFATADFARAAAVFEQLEDMAGKIAGAIQEQWPADEPHGRVGAVLGYYTHLARGFRAFAIGMQNMLGRTPSVAIEAFDAAGSLFRELSEATNDSHWSAFADYAECNQQAARGLENLFRLNNDAAAAAFMVAAARARTLLEVTLPSLLAAPEASSLLSGIATGVQTSLTGFTQGFALASFRAQVASGNLSAALPHARERLELAKQLAAVSGLPPVFRDLLQASVYQAQADVEMTEGHVLRENRDWDAASAAYARARTAIQSAAALMAGSSIPDAAAGQESLLNQANGVAIWIRQCDRERQFAEESLRVKDEFSSFQTLLVQAVRNSGVVVNNNNDVVTSVQQQATLTNRVEVRLRDAFQDLRSAASAADLPPDTKSAIIKKTDEALQAADRGLAFVDKVEQIGKDVIDQVRKAGPFAAALYPAAKVIGGFLGIPVPF